VKGGREREDSCFDLHMIRCVPIRVHFPGSLTYVSDAPEG